MKLRIEEGKIYANVPFMYFVLLHFSSQACIHFLAINRTGKNMRADSYKRQY